MRAKTKLSEFEQQIADQIKAGKPLTGADGIFTPIMKRVLESMLQQELESHLEQTRELGGNRRNGITQKKVKSSLGSFELSSPRDRDSTFEPHVIKKRQTTLSEDIDRKILSLFSHGMSYIDIRTHISDIYGIEPSDTIINQITDKVLPDLAEWRSRPLDEVYTIIWLDAIHYSIREDGMVKSKAVYCVLGLNLEGEKDVLGFYIADRESSRFWLQVLMDLNQRGVKDVLIACTDNLSGFIHSIKQVFPQTQCQLCIIHQVRNTTRYVSFKEMRCLTQDLKKIYQAPNSEVAFTHLNMVKEKWSAKYPRLMDSWFKNWDHLSGYFKYPEVIRKMIYTTNTVEGFHRSLRKATKTKGAFTNENALAKIVYLTIIKAKRAWQRPAHNWIAIFNQLSIYFEDRITK